MFLLGCEVPRLDLLQVICSTTLQSIEGLVSFADFLIQLYCTASPPVMYQKLYVLKLPIRDNLHHEVFPQFDIFT